jgi:acyl-coenzyme A synthetase/AMP-(fatty) acid ligase
MQAVENWCRAHLPSALRPRCFFAVAALPRNAMGKLLRKHLPALAQGMENKPPC